MVKGTQAASVIEILRKIPKRIRSKVQEVTLDMAANMAVRRCGPDCQSMLSKGFKGDRPFSCPEIGL
jgi:transposase